MQRLEITADGEYLWIEPDPEGEFVRVDEAIDLQNKYNTQALNLAGAIMLLEAAKDALPSDDIVYLRIREFLDVEVNGVRSERL